VLISLLIVKKLCAIGQKVNQLDVSDRGKLLGDQNTFRYSFGKPTRLGMLEKGKTHHAGR
jgi:hypothetical protein